MMFNKSKITRDNPFNNLINEMKLSPYVLCLHKILFEQYMSGVFQDMAENIKRKKIWQKGEF